MIKKRQETNSETKEKIFLVVFLIFAIAIIILLFKAPTGHTVIGANLDKATFNASDYLEGEISLQLQKGDLLPTDMKVAIIVTRNITPCQTHWVCPNGKTIRYKHDNCSLIHADPDSLCCSIYPSSCIQLIKDSSFGASYHRETLAPDWWTIPITAEFEGDVMVNEEMIDEETGESSPVLLIENGYNGEDLTVYQLLKTIRIGITGAAIMPVTGFALPPEQHVYYCEDSDNGKDYCSKGTCYNCIDSTCTEIGTDSCSGKTLTEWYCYGGTCTSETFTCPTYCANGACSRTGIIERCVDSDDGLDYYKQGTTYSQHGLIKSVFHIDSCYNETTLQEFYCDGTTIKSVDFKCPPNYQCKNGACSKEKRELSWDLWYHAEIGCAFEIVVKGEDTANKKRNLHYYYEILNKKGCAIPSTTGEDHYISMELPGMGWEEGTGWHSYKRDLFSDWIGQGWSKDDEITEIRLISHGNITGYDYYGQTVKFDNIKLLTSFEPSKECEKRGKECCLEGTGSGQYLGEQLECPEDKGCWESCLPSKILTLSSFKAGSSTPTKYNKTTGPYTCVGCKNLIADQYLGGSGSGYTACLDTSSTSPKTKCRDWDNTYHYDIYKSRLRAPAENGTYFLTTQLRWTPPYANETVFYETRTKFNVGEGGGYVPTCDWDNTTTWGNWSECDFTAGTKTRTRNCTLRVGTATECEPFKAECTTETKTFTECIILPACTTDDYDLYDEWCNNWAPSPCMPDETQTRTCEADINVCNDTASDAESPVETRECTIEVITEYVKEQETAGKKRSEIKDELEEFMWTSSDIKIILDDVYGEEEGARWWIWMLIIMVIISAAVLFYLLRMKKKPKAGKAAVPAELLSYIKDAIAAGATKAEIASRLVQAGWSRESVDAAIKTLK